MIDMIILDADLDDGSGEIFVTSEFTKLNGLLKADILQEWIGLLELEYEYALRDFNEELKELGAIEWETKPQRR